MMIGKRIAWTGLAGAVIVLLAVLAAGITAQQVAGQSAAHRGVLPLLFEAAYAGAGIDNQAIVGGNCRYGQFWNGDVGSGDTVVADAQGWPATATKLEIKCIQITDSGREIDRSVVIPRDSGSSTTLPDGSVTHPKLAADAVEGENIKLGTIRGAHIATGAITGLQIHDNTLDAAKLTDGSVNSRVVADQSLRGEDLAHNTITSREIETGGILTENYADGSITTAKLAPNVAVSNAIRGFRLMWPGTDAPDVSRSDTVIPINLFIAEQGATEQFPNFSQEYTSRWSDHIYGAEEDYILSAVRTGATEGPGTTFTLPSGIYRVKFQVQLSRISGQLNAGQHFDILLGFSNTIDGNFRVRVSNENGFQVAANETNSLGKIRTIRAVTVTNANPTYELVIDDLIVKQAQTGENFLIELETSSLTAFTGNNQVRVERITGELWRKG